MSVRHTLRGLLIVAGALSLGACSGSGSLADRGRADGWSLYAGLIQTQGYTVGSALSSSGLFVRSGGQWNHVGWNTPRISGVSVDATNPATIFLASGNGVLRSFDGGANWKVVTGWEVTEVQDVAVDPTNPQDVYLASAYGIWTSRDRGETWRESNSGIIRKYTQTIEVDANTPRRVVAGTEMGIYLSENGGADWRSVGPKGNEILDIQQSVSSPEMWIAASEGAGIWLSNDGARTWTQQAGSDGLSFYGAAVDPGDAGTIAATGWETNVWLTRNKGAEWTVIGRELPSASAYELVFDRNVPGRLWVATLEQGVFYTDDFGASWSDPVLPGTLVFDMLYVPTRKGEEGDR